MAQNADAVMDAGPLRRGYRRGRSVPPRQRRHVGMIPLIIMAILAFPDDLFAHRGLTAFVLSVKTG